MDQGSTLIGFLAGFFLGCIGLILVMFISRKPKTRSGAWIGFFAQLVLGVIGAVATMM